MIEALGVNGTEGKAGGRRARQGSARGQRVRPATFGGVRARGDDRQARAAAEALGKALKDKDLSVRYDAAQSLSVFGPDAKAALPALTAALDEEDVEVLKKVIYALGEMGPSADQASAAIGKSMGHADEDVRMRPPTPWRPWLGRHPRRPGAHQGLERSAIGVRAASAYAMGELGPTIRGPWRP